MTKLRNMLALALLAMAPTLSLEAKDNEALPFIRIVRDPSAAAMGFSGAASSASVAYSSFRNASVIPFYAGSGDAAFSYQSWAPDGVKTNNFNLGAGFKLLKGKLGLAIGGAYQTGEEYSVFDENGNANGTFTPNEMLVNFGAGMLITENLSAGINVRYAKQSVSDDYDMDAFSTDLFVSYRLTDFNFSVGLSSLGSSVQDSEDNDFNIPTSATIAGEFHKIFGEVHGLRVDADADYFFSGNFTFAIGAEYSWKDMIFVRTGAHIGGDDAVLPTFFTAGAGVRFGGFSLNAAWLTGNDTLKNTITAGIGFSF